jgi:hypothetical protein
MPVPIAFALLAQVAGAAPASAAPANPAPAADGQVTSGGEVKTADRCPTLPATAQPGEIVVCGKRPEGYRLDPDVMEAKRAMRGGGRPKRPDRMKDTSCAIVGEAGCIGAAAGINLLGAAMTAAEMAARLAKGQGIGSMFVTDPTPSEYQLYLEAKRRREAKEAEAAAVAKAKAKAGQAQDKAGATPATGSESAPKP